MPNTIIAFFAVDGSSGNLGSSPIDSRYSEYKSHKVKIYIGLRKNHLLSWSLWLLETTCIDKFLL